VGQVGKSNGGRCQPLNLQLVQQFSIGVG